MGGYAPPPGKDVALLAPRDPWLAALIRRHQAALAAELAAVAQQTIPFYHRTPHATLEASFARFYAALATAAAGDLDPLRSYLTTVVAVRLAAGVEAQQFIALAQLTTGGVRGLIEAERATQPDHASLATQQFTGLLMTIRLILSEVNLRRLTQPPAP